MTGPAMRPGDPKAHLVPEAEQYALCGRPPGAGTGWHRLKQQPAAGDRCPDCVTAGQHLPHRPAVPIYPWRP